jgi:predicted deacylase
MPKHSTAIDRQPNYIRVTHADQHTKLAHFRLGEGRRRILIIAGVHGREHGGIQASYEILERLSNRHVYGRVDVVPVCNPPAYKAETRFSPRSNHDMARSFTPNPPSNLTQALSHAVLNLTEGAEAVLSLHSAGDARYLPHSMFYREQHAEFAASLGFPFAIKRGTPETLKHHIASRLRPEQRMVALELGGGTVAYPQDVSLGVDRVLAFLGRSGFLGPGKYDRKPTPPDMIWLTDVRQPVRAPGEGAFYTHTEPGADFSKREQFGFWVGLEDLCPRPLLAPTTGKLIYLRTRNRAPAGGNVAMFLPTRGSTVNQPEP